MNSTEKKPRGIFPTVWDERQQQAYQRVSSTALNIAWVLLLAAFLLQVILYPREPLRWVAEMAIFAILTVFIGFSYRRVGLWTKASQKPSLRQNVVASVVAALLITIMTLVRAGISGKWTSISILGMSLPVPLFLLLQATVVFLLALGLLSLVGRSYRRKQRQVDESLDQDA